MSASGIRALTRGAIAACIAVTAGLAPAAERVTICHQPGTPQEVTKQVSPAKAAVHLGHGDVAGPCKPCLASAAPSSGPIGTAVTLKGRNLFPGMEVRFDGTFTPSGGGNPVPVALVHDGGALHQVKKKKAIAVVGEVLPDTLDLLALARLGSGALDGTLTSSIPAGASCQIPFHFALTPSAGFIDGLGQPVTMLGGFAGDVQQVPPALRYRVRIKVPDSSKVLGITRPAQILVNVVNGSAPPPGLAPAEVTVALALVDTKKKMLTYQSTKAVVPYAAPVPASVPNDIELVFAGGSGLGLVVVGAAP